MDSYERRIFYVGLVVVPAALGFSAVYWHKTYQLHRDAEELKAAVQQLQDKQYDNGDAVPKP